MRKLTVILLLFAITFLSTSCGTLFMGKIDECQKVKPKPGDRKRAIRPGIFVLDFCFYGVPLIIDFATGAIYRNCQDNIKK